MFKINNLSIRNKILFIALIGWCGLIVNIYYTNAVVKENSSRLETITNIYFPIIERSDACAAYFDKIKKSFREAVSTGETIFIDEAKVVRDDIRRSLDYIKVISPNKSGTVENLISKFNTYYTSNERLAKGIISGKLQSLSLKNAIDEKNISTEIFEDSLSDFRNSNFKIFSSIIGETDSSAQNSLDVGIIIFILVVWLLMFSTLAVTTSITSSFNNVIDSLKNMAKGKIDKNSIINQPEDDDVPKELLEIKDALDSVTKRFTKTEKEIWDLNYSLQNKVDEATSELLSVNEKLKEAVTSANQANKAKSTFLANMSHELRTPMNAIIGYGEILEEDIKNQEYKNMAPDIKKVRSASNHLLSLISDILDLSKIEAGKMEFTPVPFNLVQLAEEIEATIKPLILDGNNTYKIEINAISNEMFTDLTKLKQILLNLLSNACKFTREGEIKLTISSHYKNQIHCLQFEVSDTGIGIPADKIASLFDSFTQVDSTTTKKFGGTGLGLAISRRYAQVMGGDIYAESKENVGSKFILTTPLHYATDMAS